MSFSREIRATALLAGPVVAAQLGHTSMSFIDTLMVGRLGPEALAGVALGSSIFFFVFVFCLGVLMAVGPMVAHAYGADDPEPIGRSVRQGFWLAAALGVPASILLWNAEPFLRLTGQTEEAVIGASGYLRAIVWGLLPALFLVVLRAFMEALSRPWPVTIITLAGVAVNAVSNYLLMFGVPGVIPPLGLVGTGLASTIVFASMFLLLVAYIVAQRDLRVFGIFRRLGRPDPYYFRELFRIGWPIGITMGVETSLFVITALLIGTLGTVPLAAHQIALQCAAFTFMVPLGIGIATSVRVGQFAGRLDRRGSRIAGFAGLSLSASFMLFAALAFWLAPLEIVGLYLDAGSEEAMPVVDLAVSLLGIAAIFQLFDGLQVSAGGALRGLKDTRVPMIIGAISYLGIGLATGYVSGFVVGFGVRGLWWGLVLGLATAATLLTWRFAAMTEPAKEWDAGHYERLLEESRK
ncbi:MAG: MATE family efflux transporter [Bacteroidota bacterium]